MKKFILYILVFFAIIGTVDFVTGKVFRYIQTKAGGRTGAEWYVCKEMKEDIIIMGSSRASHHYVPQIIVDSLGMSCFNAGQDGNGIILQYGRWKMISERYTPKLIIYDVNPSFDLCQTDNMAYIDRLKPFCNDSEIRDYVTELFPLERFKLASQIYRYNYKFMEMISDCFRGSENKNKGYIPLGGSIRKEMIENARQNKEPIISIDETKIHFLEQLARECQDKGTKLVFVASPAFRGGGYNQASFNVVSRIAKEYGASFFYYYDSEFSEDPGNFTDSQHLNDDGAVAFTKEITSNVRLF